MAGRAKDHLHPWTNPDPANTIYDSLEIGISAYNEQDKSATLYADDVSISNQPLKE